MTAANGSLIDAKTVIDIHDLILSTESGLPGNHGDAAIEGALGRIESHIYYAGLDDIFEIAAMYAVSISRGHIFNDANKRTGLVTALTYLSLQGVEIPRDSFLEDIMVWVAEGDIEAGDLATILYSIAVNGSVIQPEESEQPEEPEEP